MCRGTGRGTASGQSQSLQGENRLFGKNGPAFGLFRT